MRRSLILKSVTATWAAVIVSGLTGFLLTPFILHRLGDEAYGLWVLIVALSDYYLFLQVGIRSAIVRYVSRSLGLQDLEELKRITATSFYFYLAAFGFVVCLALGLAPHAAHFFSVKPQNATAFTRLFVILGIAQACDFPLSLFEGCLEAVGRFDQLYGLRITGMLVRVGLIIVVLERGGGLFGVGAATVLSTLSMRFISVPLAFREVEGLTLHRRYIDRKSFKEMLSYGVTSFAVGLGIRLRDSLYPIVIVKFLSASAVTLFALPTKLLSIPLSGIGSMTEFVNPLSSRLDARQDKEGLRRVLTTSTEAAFMIFAPLAALMIVFGREMISLWVGQAYASSYPLLVFLTFGLGISATQASTQSLIFGIGRHRPLVLLRLTEGVGTALLGILLIRFMGLTGYAIASMVVPVVVNLVVMPRYACGVLGASFSSYLLNGCVKASVLSVPLAIWLMAFHHFFPPSKWIVILIGAASGGCIYLLTLLTAALAGRRVRLRWLRLDTLDILQKGLLRRGPEHVEIAAAPKEEIADELHQKHDSAQ